MQSKKKLTVFALVLLLGLLLAELVLLFAVKSQPIVSQIEISVAHAVGSDVGHAQIRSSIYHLMATISASILFMGVVLVGLFSTPRSRHGEAIETRPERFINLDALRGVAAIAVVVGHAQGLGILGIHFVGRSYLAVDFFFTLSGFVIASAYGKNLETGRLTLSRFLQIRIIRFAPMVLLGGFLSATALLALYISGRIGVMALLLNTLANTVLVPFGVVTSFTLDPYLFHLNPPLWSLFYELIVNIVWATLLALSPKLLKGLWLAMPLAILFLSIRASNLDVGPTPDLFGVGGALARSFFGIAFGAVLFNNLGHLRRNLGWLRPWMGYVSVACVFLVPMSGNRWLDYLYDITVVLWVFPLVVLACSTLETRRRDSRLRSVSIVIRKFLGEISFPIYVIHYPLLAALAQSGIHLSLELSALFLTALLFLAYLLAVYFDAPIRSRLRAQVLGRVDQSKRSS